jgi:hypothetical protein
MPNNLLSREKQHLANLLEAIQRCVYFLNASHAAILTSHIKVYKCLFYIGEEKKPGTTMQWNKREIKKHK